MKCEVQ